MKLKLSPVINRKAILETITSGRHSSQWKLLETEARLFSHVCVAVEALWFVTVVACDLLHKYYLWTTFEKKSHEVIPIVSISFLLS